MLNFIKVVSGTPRLMLHMAGESKEIFRRKFLKQKKGIFTAVLR